MVPPAQPAVQAPLAQPPVTQAAPDQQATPVPQLVPPPHAGAVRVALLAPFSGPAAAVGQSLSNAAQLALFDVADKSLWFLPVDTKGTAEGAAAAAQIAVSQGADIVLGPLFSSEVKAATPIIRERGISMVAFTTDRGAVGQDVYALGFLPQQQVSRITNFLVSKGKSHFAILARNDDYGRAVVAALKDAVDRLPPGAAQIVQIGYYDPQAKDLDQQVKSFVHFDQRKAKLEAQRKRAEAKGDITTLRSLEGQEAVAPDFDTLFLPDEGTRLRNLASFLPVFGVDIKQVQLVGTMLWSESHPNAENALIGGWYPAAPDDRWPDFDSRYGKSFGGKPPRIASLAYDAMALAAVLGKRQPMDFSPQTLTQSTGFAGIDGIFRLRTDGTAERGLAVMEVDAAGAHVVDAAPQRFGD